MTKKKTTKKASKKIGKVPKASAKKAAGKKTSKKTTTKKAKGRTWVVDRSCWARGHIGGAPRLLNSQGNMCCLGHMCLQAGFTKDNIKDLSMPTDITVVLDGFTVLDKDRFCDLAATINDSESIADNQRERLLRKLVQKAGDTIRFSGVHVHGAVVEASSPFSTIIKSELEDKIESFKP